MKKRIFQKPELFSSDGLRITTEQRVVLQRIAAKVEQDMKNPNTQEDWDKSHNWNHVWRVIRYAEMICCNEPDTDHFIALMGAVTHDIGRIVEAKSRIKLKADHGNL